MANDKPKKNPFPSKDQIQLNTDWKRVKEVRQLRARNDALKEKYAGRPIDTPILTESQKRLLQETYQESGDPELDKFMQQALEVPSAPRSQYNDDNDPSLK